MKTKKLKKPRPDFPLFAHQSGQWAKKIRGRTHYFGTDADAALDKYLETKDELQAGRTPRIKADEITLRQLVNRYLTAKKLQVDAGELKQLSFADYERVCASMIAYFGASRSVIDLRPEDFAAYRAKLSKTLGAGSIGGPVVRARMVFKWGYENGILDKQVRFGTGFSRPSAKAVRRARRESGSKMIEADEIRKVLSVARQPLKAMVLLGINCGFGQTDVATVPLEAIDLQGGWVNFERPKTETQRRCPLWPETVEALREAIRLRKKPASANVTKLAFLTHHGHQWIRHQISAKGTIYYNDYVAAEYCKILKANGLKRRGSFYNLRHAFRTVADESKDRPAIDAIMGHVDQTMADYYRERISDERLRAVANLVHDWLWPAKVTLKASTTGATK
ncbi:MAG: site-specific integrase [Planctomycetes bacterium]|nr:site-specific integrase [Planctomycetota bacterium]